MNQMKKEELEITISDSDRIECAIRHIESSLDVDPWAVEIAVEAMEKEISALQAQEARHSNESSLTHKALDTIKPMRAIDANKLLRDIEKYHLSDGKFQHWVQIQPTIEPETCEDAVSRNAIIQKLNTMDRYVSEELILCDTDKKFPKNEVFIVDDVYEEIVENLPSAHSEIEERTEESAQNVPKEDLISRKATIDAINKALDRETLLNSFVRKVAVDALKTMPSAEPEIVRCKDCQHFRTYYHGTESDPVITHACVWFLDREMGLEDYCSKGVFR